MAWLVYLTIGNVSKHTYPLSARSPRFNLASGEYPPEFITEGLHPVFVPFWVNLPHSNIFTSIPPHPRLQHWKDGISHVKQWTGTDHKQLQWIFVTTLASHVLLDFIYLAQYHSHIDMTLQALQHALDDFHAIKDIFVSLGCCQHFNISKLHSLIHYIKSIQLFSSLDDFNIENLKWLHIDYVKKAY
ncbi:hypothetical protein HD554DRAFT_2207962 [Boletus coccyginus]|nr:hypothetical protein HD554DRAFT_2207962 [Boletus coccyginus]